MSIRRSASAVHRYLRKLLRCNRDFHERDKLTMCLVNLRIIHIVILSEAKDLRSCL
jgi:hypothetical protein